MLRRIPKLYLASESPRRVALLESVFISFTAAAPNIDETHRDGESPVDYVERLALEKTLATRGGTEAVIIGADTVVVLDDEILGKPRDATEAQSTLTRLSGRSHHVITGLAVRRVDEGSSPDEDRLAVGSTISQVTFVQLSPDEITAYIATGEPMGKAGAYAIQGAGGAFVSEISGNYQNIVGLPLTLLRRLINDLGYLWPGLPVGPYT